MSYELGMYGRYPSCAGDIENIFSVMQREATAIDCYNRLAQYSSDLNHKNNILQALEDTKLHLSQLTEFYVNITRRQPRHEIKRVTFNTYKEGLQKAQRIAEKTYEKYRNLYLLTQHSPLQYVCWRACNSKVNLAHLFRTLSFTQDKIDLQDYGKDSFVVDINKAAKQNNTFRTALWTGDHLQVTLMRINVGDDIGLEVHPAVDQFLRIEEGQGLVLMGDSRNQLNFKAKVYDDYAIMIPAGKWHNLINTGDKPLKLYSIYAPPEHPFGTVHETKNDAMEAEDK
ncbi:cupin domain-containing protein [Baia soyae]|uniref:Mannose-6-phosphate isomerase-like protein (Cupin superfamily) n=1 Tax=Baia soyae TaxID=1544746 RepID=A0A4R2RI60_9BACL|nr:cupin domain-containing protein [Baia soyae]TCP62149.1 mannose-6-phosphate isomerase-like protein (cupin superfamily) [Baia soyae]